MEKVDAWRPRGPEPLEEIVVSHPAVSAGDFSRGEGLEGVRILHLSDFHCRAKPGTMGREKVSRLCEAVAEARADMVAITGDCMDEPGDESAAVVLLGQLSECWGKPRLGAYLVMGNHDSVEFGERVRREVCGVRVLENERTAAEAEVSGRRVRMGVVGLSWPEDALGAAMKGSGEMGGEFVVVLAHVPSAVYACAEFGWALVLSGHTHGGQVRWSARYAPHTSSDVPGRLASGMLRLRSTLCCVSRGIGDGVMAGLRVNCAWQAPVYVLGHGAMERREPGNGEVMEVRQIQGW